MGNQRFLKPDLYIVAPIPEHLTLDFQKDLLRQFFTYEQQLDLFLLLTSPRILSITPAFVVLVTPLLGDELTESGVRRLNTLKEQGVIDQYRVVPR
jgi:hypothetical protein